MDPICVFCEKGINHGYIEFFGESPLHEECYQRLQEEMNDMVPTSEEELVLVPDLEDYGFSPESI